MLVDPVFMFNPVHHPMPSSIISFHRQSFSGTHSHHPLQLPPHSFHLRDNWWARRLIVTCVLLSFLYHFFIGYVPTYSALYWRMQIHKHKKNTHKCLHSHLHLDPTYSRSINLHMHACMNEEGPHCSPDYVAITDDDDIRRRRIRPLQIT